MKCKIEINMDNAAFDDPEELSRILHRLASDVRSFDLAYRDYRLMDINGNIVGTCKITGRRG